jgi:hypothetical protein
VFILTSNMFGLAILSLGIIGIIVSLLIPSKKRFLIGISLSGFLMALGVFYVVDTSLRQWFTARRIAKIQAQNRESLEALKARLAEKPAPALEAKAEPKPAAGKPAPERKKAR